MAIIALRFIIVINILLPSACISSSVLHTLCYADILKNISIKEKKKPPE